MKEQDSEWDIDSIPNHEQNANSFMLNVNNLKGAYPDFTIQAKFLGDAYLEQFGDMASRHPGDMAERISSNLHEIEVKSTDESHVHVNLQGNNRETGDELIEKVMQYGENFNGVKVTESYFYTENDQTATLAVALGFIF